MTWDAIPLLAHWHAPPRGGVAADSASSREEVHNETRITSVQFFASARQISASTIACRGYV